MERSENHTERGWDTIRSENETTLMGAKVNIEGVCIYKLGFFGLIPIASAEWSICNLKPFRRLLRIGYYNWEGMFKFNVMSSVK